MGRAVVVEQALRDMQDIGAIEALLLQPRQHVSKVARIRLIGTDILRRVDGVEFDTKPLVAGREALRSTLERMTSLWCCLR